MKPEPIFIVGQYKCGTTWLLNILVNHPQVVAISEFDIIKATCRFDGVNVSLLPQQERLKNFFDGSNWCTKFDGADWKYKDTIARFEAGDTFEQVKADPNKVQKFMHLDSETAHKLYNIIKNAASTFEVMDAFYDAITTGCDDKKYMVIKAADQVSVFDILEAWKPDALKINITRDGRDASISATHYRKLMKEREAPWHKAEESRNYMELLRSWTHRANLVQEYSGMGKLLTTRYEDLTNNFKPTLASILDYLDLGYTDELLEHIQEKTSFKKMAKRPRGVEAKSSLRKGSIGEWIETLSADDKEQAWEIAGRTLTSFGYTKDGEIKSFDPTFKGNRISTRYDHEKNAFIAVNQIESSNPRANPATIKWDTGDQQLTGILTVSTNQKAEQRVAKGIKGEKQVPWIKPNIRYDFSLYADSDQSELITQFSYKHIRELIFN